MILWFATGRIWLFGGSQKRFSCGFDSILYSYSNNKVRLCLVYLQMRFSLTSKIQFQARTCSQSTATPTALPVTAVWRAQEEMNLRWVTMIPFHLALCFCARLGNSHKVKFFHWFSSSSRWGECEENLECEESFGSETMAWKRLGHLDRRSD
jgi:hypothetical protein